MIVKCVIFPFLIFVIQFILQEAKKYNVEIERAELQSFNPTYIESWSMQTRRRSRNAPYTFSLNFTLVYPADNNVTVHIVMYEKVNAGYKLTPLEIHFRLCEWFRRDLLIIPIILRYDIHHSFETCPLKGLVQIKDLIIRSEDAPTGFWPFVKNKLMLDFYSTATKENVVKFNFYLSVNEVPERKNKGKNVKN